MRAKVKLQNGRKGNLTKRLGRLVERLVGLSREDHEVAIDGDLETGDGDGPEVETGDDHEVGTGDDHEVGTGDREVEIAGDLVIIGDPDREIGQKQIDITTSEGDLVVLLITNLQ